MKYILILSVIFVIGCAQLMNGQIQPVTLKDAKNKVWFTTCSGASEDWYSCNQKAIKTCQNGYYALDKYENANGGIRELTFKCN